MRQFKDKAAASWTIDLTIGTVARVKSASEGRFNLIDPAPQLADELARDELTFSTRAAMPCSGARPAWRC